MAKGLIEPLVKLKPEAFGKRRAGRRDQFLDALKAQAQRSHLMGRFRPNRPVALGQPR